MTIEAQSELQTRYRQNGFHLQADSYLPTGIVQKAVTGMDAIREGRYDRGRPPRDSPWKPGDDPNQLCKIEMPQIADSAVRELVSHPLLGELAAAVTGARRVQVWWVQLLYKPPATGSSKPTVGWHQDWQYWQPAWADGSDLFTAWVALSDVNEESGPMRFVRGSQVWGLVKGDFFGDFEGQQVAAPEGSTWEEATAVLPPGGVSIHDKLVLHGSGINTSSGPRRSFAIHMRTEHSAPRDDRREGLTEFVDNLDYCPVIYER